MPVHVLEGSVRRSNNRLRITAQLVDANTGYHLWSETYDREFDDVFRIQDEISKAVVDALKIKLLGNSLPGRNGTENVQAFELYLKARYFFNHTTEDNLSKSDAALQEAVRLDPGYAKAWALLADAHTSRVGGWASSSEGFIEGFKVVQGYANRAASADPNSPEALVAVGLAMSVAELRHRDAAAMYEKALEVEPGNVDALSWLATTRLWQGRFGDAQALGRRALDIDPLSLQAKRQLADSYTMSGEYDRGIALYEEILQIDPDIARINARVARAWLAKGDLDQASDYGRREPVEWARELIEIFVAIRQQPEQAWREAALAYADKWGTPNAFQLAEIYAWAGDKEEAFRWLGIAREVHDPGIFWSKISLHFGPIKDDPRWPQHLEDVGLGD